AGRIGVRAPDDRTVEFRLAAPTPYFMSVMNRPDGGPQPRHAIERYGAEWTRPEVQVVSGPFRQHHRSDHELALVRQDGYSGIRPGNVARLEVKGIPAREALEPYERDELDMIGIRYTPRLADL